jgi:hypothetical protein
MTQRLVRHPYLALFDGPDTNAPTDSRTRSTVPLQALYLMNNPFVRERAEGFAARLTSASDDPTARIRLATELAWNRPPTADEVERFRAFVASYARGSVRAGASPAEAARDAWVSLARVVLTANEFIYLD